MACAESLATFNDKSTTQCSIRLNTTYLTSRYIVIEQKDITNKRTPCSVQVTLSEPSINPSLQEQVNNPSPDRPQSCEQRSSVQAATEKYRSREVDDGGGEGDPPY